MTAVRADSTPASAGVQLDHHFELRTEAPFRAEDYGTLWDALTAASATLSGIAGEPRCWLGDARRMAPAGQVIAALSDDLERLASRVLDLARADETLVSEDDLERRAWLEIRASALCAGEITSHLALTIRKLQEVDRASRTFGR